MTGVTNTSDYRGNRDSRGGLIVAIILLLLLLGLGSFALIRLWFGLGDANKEMDAQDNRISQLKSDLSDAKESVLGVQDTSTITPDEETETPAEDTIPAADTIQNFYATYPSYSYPKTYKTYYLDPTGSLVPPVGSTYNLGAPATTWKNAYIDTVNSTDVNSTNVNTTNVNATTVNATVINGELNGCVMTSGGSKYCDSATVASTLSVAGNTELNSDLKVGGNTGLAGNLEVGGDAGVIGNFDVQGDSEMDGTLGVDGTIYARGGIRNDTSGPVRINDALYTQGTAYFAGTVLNGGNVYFGQNTYSFGNVNPMFDAAASPSDIGSAARRWDDVYARNFWGTFNGDINGCLTTAGGSEYCDDATVAGNLTVNGDAKVAGTLTVEDEATFEDRVTVETRLNVNGSIGSGDGQKLIVADREGLSVQDRSGNEYFSVDTQTGEIAANGNVDISGDLNVDGTTVNMINAQLTVRDLIVSGRANVHSFNSDLMPLNTNVYDIGSAALRWRNIFAINGRFSGSLFVNGLNIETKLEQIDLVNANQDAAIAGLSTRMTSAENRISALEKKVTLSGVQAACTGTARANPITCTVNVGYPMTGITVTAIGNGAVGRYLMAVVTSYNLAAGTANVAVYGDPIIGSQVNGVMWTAVTNQP